MVGLSPVRPRGEAPIPHFRTIPFLRVNFHGGGLQTFDPFPEPVCRMPFWHHRNASLRELTNAKQRFIGIENDDLPLHARFEYIPDERLGIDSPAIEIELDLIPSDLEGFL